MPPTKSAAGNELETNPNNSKFDPARHGFGFRNPIGRASHKTGWGRIPRWFDAFVYGRGLCFGMAAAVLLSFSGEAKEIRSPLADHSLTPDLLAVLRKYQLRQFSPRMILATVLDWVASRGGRSERVLERLRLVGEGSDPHVLCFGPAPNRRFLQCLARAHAVVPYRIEEGRVYVYDPNHPRDRERFVKFMHGEFEYSGFRSREGWGITLVPGKALPGRSANPSTTGQRLVHSRGTVTSFATTTSTSDTGVRKK